MLLLISIRSTSVTLINYAQHQVDKMNEMLNGVTTEGISIHNFTEKILEQVIHFHVMKLSDSFFLWVGSSPVLSSLAVSMSSKYVSHTLTLSNI